MLKISQKATEAGNFILKTAPAAHRVCAFPTETRVCDYNIKRSAVQRLSNETEGGKERKLIKIQTQSRCQLLNSQFSDYSTLQTGFIGINESKCK